MKDKEFLNFMFTKNADLSFVHSKQSVKCAEMILWLQSKQKWADEHNQGFIAWDILTQKADPNKLYSVWNDYLKPSAETSSADHMPDREVKATEDLPF
jgi:DUF971 family protein|tara:strand:- start:749 stop:1042 length:294 start_codon:yes stop_codon:yes gene_type:complete